MLFGFTGTGKSTIARAIGSEYVKHVPNGTFVIISSSFYQSAYIGISKKTLLLYLRCLAHFPHAWYSWMKLRIHSGNENLGIQIMYEKTL